MADELVRGLPEKLLVTAALLGCADQKDFCATFRRVNPNTDFDLERSYKWMQGRALPRSARVYQDWAALVGTPERLHPWLASCPLGEFVDVVCTRHGEEPNAVLRRAGLADTTIAAMRTDLAEAMGSGLDGYLCGAYACYSHAQSPHYRGRIIRGAVVIAPAACRADGLVATYSQTLAVGRAQASGPVGLYGLALCVELRTPSSGLAPLFCGLFRPSPPASVLAGKMCGITAMDAGGQPPYATRIAMVRVPNTAGLERSNRYVDPAEGPLSGDLAALSLPIPDPAGLDTQLDRFLHPDEGGAAGRDRAAVATYAALAMVYDRAWLGTGAPVRPSDGPARRRESRRGPE